jgi:pyridoxal biosynthesis lyase PdxS
MTGTNNNGSGNGATVGTDRVKMGLAQMLKGGVIVSRLKERERDREREG